MVKKRIILLVFVILMIALLSACKGDNKATETPAATTAAAGDTAAPAGTSSADPAAGFSDLKIKVLGYQQTGNNVPGNDVLTPIWRAKTKVIPEIVSAPQGEAGKGYIQKQVVANTLPEVIALVGQARSGESYNIMKASNKIREITKDDIIKYMPRTVAWLTKMGGTVDQFYQDNLDNKDGKMWWIPNYAGGGATLLPGYVGTKMYDSITNMRPYQNYMRDDILKKIFPDVKTEAELSAQYIANGGKLSFAEVTDVPLNSMDDLLAYWKKVKELNLKVGDKPVYGGQPFSSSQNVNSLLWSAFTIPGYMWTQTGERTQKGNVLTYVPLTPEWKDYYKFWNTAYNQGYLDPEAFIQKDDQLNAKIINGQYAMFNMWGPVAAARELSKKESRGYGYRMVPLFRSQAMVNKYQDYTPQPVNLDGSFMGVVLTTTLKDKDYAQVLNWIDWNMSEEANNLRTWGLPEWSTGTGKDRRFKPEYKQLEDWAVRGVKSEKDGNYYGLYDVTTNATQNVAAWNHETFGILGMGYADSPFFTYPVDLTKKDINLDQVADQVQTKHYVDQMVFYHQTGFDFSQLDPDGKFDKVDVTNGVYSSAAASKIVKTIVGKPADFDKNYEAYLGVYNDSWRSEWKLMQDRWKAIYDKSVAPQIEIAKAKKK